jgi:hypothetical protein
MNIRIKDTYLVDVAMHRESHRQIGSNGALSDTSLATYDSDLMFDQRHVFFDLLLFIFHAASTPI